MHRELRSAPLHANLIPPIPIRWGITCADPLTAIYPPASDVPNTYWFKFVDGTFTQGADGAITPTWTDRSSEPKSVVQNLADTLDSYIPEGTTVPIWRYRSRWWTDWSIPNVHHVTTGVGAIGAGASASVTLPNGRTVTAVNWSTDTTIDGGSRCLCWRDQWNGTFYLVKTGGESNSRVWHAEAVDDIDAGASGTVELPDATEVEAENWTDTVDIESEDKILVWQDPVDDLYYAMKSEKQAVLREYKGTIDGTIAAGTTTAVNVSSVVALDGGTTPAITSVENPYALCAQNGTQCLIGEDLTAESAAYFLKQVRHVKRSPLSTVTYNSGTHKLKRTLLDLVVQFAGDGTTDEDILTAVEITPVTNVVDNGTTLDQTKQAGVYVFEAGAEGDSEIAAIDACEE